jgi:hypothetical protein
MRRALAHLILASLTASAACVLGPGCGSEEATPPAETGGAAGTPSGQDAASEGDVSAEQAPDAGKPDVVDAAKETAAESGPDAAPDTKPDAIDAPLDVGKPDVLDAPVDSPPPDGADAPDAKDAPAPDVADVVTDPVSNDTQDGAKDAPVGDATDGGSDAADAAGTCDAEAGCGSIKTGLIAYWKLDENAGGTANDSSGNNLHGTLQGPVWTAGKAGSALKFDGVNDLVDCGASTIFNQIQTQLTLAAWFRLDTDPYAITQNRSYILDKGGAWRLWYSATGEGQSDPDQVFFDLWDWQGVNTASSTTWQQNVWYHVVGTYDGAKAVVYVNGVQSAQANVTKSLHVTGYKVMLGVDSELNGTKYFLNGAIDEAAVWKRALTAAEVQSLFAANGVVQ